MRFNRKGSQQTAQSAGPAATDRLALAQCATRTAAERCRNRIRWGRFIGFQRMLAQTEVDSWRECSPAAGTGAAIEVVQDFGTSCWRLSNKATPVAGARSEPGVNTSKTDSSNGDFVEF